MQAFGENVGLAPLARSPFQIDLDDFARGEGCAAPVPLAPHLTRADIDRPYGPVAGDAVQDGIKLRDIPLVELALPIRG